MSHILSDNSTHTFHHLRDHSETIDKHFYSKKRSGISTGEISITGQEIEPVQLRSHKNDSNYMARRLNGQKAKDTSKVGQNEYYQFQPNTKEGLIKPN